MKKPEEVYHGEWDFHGSCAPPEDGGEGSWIGQETFTLGCFQWVRRGGGGQGVGLKKGRVRYRVKGLTSEPAAAYQEAREFCARKNAEKSST